MSKNPTISEFEMMTTHRMLERARRQEHYDYTGLLARAVFHANAILAEIGLSGDLWIRQRGRRALVFYQGGRVVGEVGLNGTKVVILNRTGLTNHKTIADLVPAIFSNNYRSHRARKKLWERRANLRKETR